MNFMGRISYGMYINHVFMLLLTPWLLKQVGLSMPESLILRFAILTEKWGVHRKPTHH